MPAGNNVVLLTPHGRAAIASLLVEGSDATPLVSSLFQPAGGRTLEQRPCGEIAFGRWPSSEVGEEVVVCRRADDAIEIHCHGGLAASRAIIATLVAHGCQEISWIDWIRRNAVDPIAADARIALAGASTERTALLLWQQHEGALRRALENVVALLADDRLAKAGQCVDDLLQWSNVGLHLVKPWRVVLAGRPNVGKSSLINALAGYERAIVHSTPGTTRDVVTMSTALDGWPVELADTAGMRSGGGALETQGIERARTEAAGADLVVHVFDLNASWSGEDQQIANQFPLALPVANKCDLPAVAGFRDAIEVSALSGDGISKLIRAIVERLVLVDPASDQALPFLPAHVIALQNARSAIEMGDGSSAARALAPLIKASS